MKLIIPLRLLNQFMDRVSETTAFLSISSDHFDANGSYDFRSHLSQASDRVRALLEGRGFCLVGDSVAVDTDEFKHVEEIARDEIAWRETGDDADYNGRYILDGISIIKDYLKSNPPHPPLGILLNQRESLAIYVDDDYKGDTVEDKTYACIRESFREAGVEPGDVGAKYRIDAATRRDYPNRTDEVFTEWEVTISGSRTHIEEYQRVLEKIA